MKDQRHHETPASIFIHAGQNHTWEILQQCASASLQQIGQDITLAIQNLFSAPALVNDVNDQIKIMTLVARKYRNHSMLPAYRFHTIVFVVLHCLAICTLGEEPKHGLLRFENILLLPNLLCSVHQSGQQLATQHAGQDRSAIQSNQMEIASSREEARFWECATLQASIKDAD